MKLIWMAMAATLGLMAPPRAVGGESDEPDASRPRPNILFCIADDATWLHFGAYGCNWVRTPGFDRVAREGLRFDRAYTPNAKCAPSRSCIITGRNSWQLGEACNHMNRFPLEYRSYVEVLAENGYSVGKTGKGWAPGVALDADEKPRELVGTGFDHIKSKPPASGISTTDYAANFAAFLDGLPAGKPFCFWYGGFEPHRVYEEGVGQRLGGKSIADVEHVPDFWPDNETVRSDMLDYAFEIEHFDRHLERMLSELESRNLLENTLVVVTADNGMPFPRAKGQAYEYSNHLPLAIMWPAGIRGGGRIVKDYVSFIDFAPTFLEIAGVDPSRSGMAPVQGRSLTHIFQSELSGQIDPARDFVLIGKERHDVGRPRNQGYPIRGVVRDDFLYLTNYEPQRWPVGNPETGYLNCDGSPTKSLILQMRRDGTDRQYWEMSFGRHPGEELFDLKNDPDCVMNLASVAQHQQRKREMKTLLETQLREQGDPRMFGKGEIFEQYKFGSPGWDNFYERFMSGERITTGWIRPTDIETEPVD